MLKTSHIKYLICTLIFSSVGFFMHLHAQIVISKPNLGFTQACANSDFNTYNVSFVFSPESSLNTSNQFILELSDPEGDFTNSTVIYTSNAGAITASPATLTFSLPEDTAGENYKLRVKSTSPAANSSASDAFAAYYKLHDTPFTINNLVSTGAFCSGNSYLLTIDNPGYGNNESPLIYPSLTYNWYKETGPSSAVFVAQGNTLAVSEEGVYFVETNYGSCTSNSYSNRVEIIEASSGEADVTISSSLGNPFCPDQGITTLSTIGGESFQWYKDGALIEDATEQMYMTQESGLYTVTIDLGDCQANGTIDLVAEGFNSSIDVSDFTTLEEGETLTVTVTTDAINPQFEWFLNNTLIENATSNTFDISQLGNYKVTIFQTTGCVSSKSYEFTVSEQYPNTDKIPNLISPNGDGINDTWMIPLRYVDGTNTKVLIYTSQGKKVYETTNYQNNWPQDQGSFNSLNSVFYYIIIPENGKELKGSISIIR